MDTRRQENATLSRSIIEGYFDYGPEWANQFLSGETNPDSLGLSNVKMQTATAGLDKEPYAEELATIQNRTNVTALSLCRYASYTGLKSLPVNRCANYISIFGAKEPPYFENSFCYYFIGNIVDQEKAADGPIWNEILKIQSVSTGFTYQAWWSDILDFPATEKIPSFIPFPEVLAIFERALVIGSPLIVERLWLTSERLQGWCAEENDNLLPHDKYGSLGQRNLSCLSILHRAVIGDADFLRRLWETSPFLQKVWSMDRKISVTQRITLLQTASQHQNQKLLSLLLKPLLQFINNPDENPAVDQSSRLLAEITQTVKDPKMKRDKKTTFAYVFFGEVLSGFLSGLTNKEVVGRSIAMLEAADINSNDDCRARINQLRRYSNQVTAFSADQISSLSASRPAKRARCSSDNEQNQLDFQQEPDVAVMSTPQVMPPVSTLPLEEEFQQVVSSYYGHSLFGSSFAQQDEEAAATHVEGNSPTYSDWSHFSPCL